MINNVLLIGTGRLPAECAKILAEQRIPFSVIEPTYDRFSVLMPTCTKLNIPYETLANKPLLRQKLETITTPTTVLSVNNDYIFPRELFCRNALHLVNFHGSLLPSYRGNGRIIPSWIIYNCEEKHGATWHVVRPDVDTGPIICQATIDVNRNDTAISLMMKVSQCGIQLFAANLKNILESKYTLLAEHSSTGQLLRLRDLPNNGEFNLNWDFDTADRFLRSMHTHPLNFLPQPVINLHNKRYRIQAFKSTRSLTAAIGSDVNCSPCNGEFQAIFKTAGGVIEMKLGHPSE